MYPLPSPRSYVSTVNHTQCKRVSILFLSLSGCVVVSLSASCLAAATASSSSSFIFVKLFARNLYANSLRKKKLHYKSQLALSQTHLEYVVYFCCMLRNDYRRQKKRKTSWPFFQYFSSPQHTHSKFWAEFR